MIRSTALLITLCLSSTIGYAVRPKPQTDDRGARGLYYSFRNDDQPDPRITYRSGVGRLFRNPALASGLRSGSQVINRQIESLMETIFYSLLDNELIFDMTDHTQFRLLLQRDLFDTAQGSFVVVDRFSMGPQYTRSFAQIGKVPVQLGIDGFVNVMNIYLSSSALRLAKAEDTSLVRRVANNWFGILPVLNFLLPPSFNPNELYDPIEQIRTPFVLPVNPTLFYDMPVGSIRSYSISGGVALPILLDESVGPETTEKFGELGKSDIAVPYTTFINGEHRINVLRKRKHIAWVGLSKIRRIGHSLGARITRDFVAFDKVSPQLPGIDLPVSPIDVELIQAKAKIFDHLYEFDLRLKKARRAYLAAVNGDFRPAWKLYQKRKKQKKQTGVWFHFTKKEDAWETDSYNNTNLFALRNTRRQEHNESEIEIIDSTGKYFILQSRQELEDRLWDVIVGPESVSYQNRADIKVEKVKKKKGRSGRYRYRFRKGDSSPTGVTLSMSINDRHVHSRELREYKQDVEDFVRLSLPGFPRFPLRDPVRKDKRIRRYSLMDEREIHVVPHVVPTFLGKFTATATAEISQSVFWNIVKTKTNKMWEAFATAYGLNPTYWMQPENREGWIPTWHWIQLASVYPARLINARSSQVDFYAATSSAIRTLKKLRTAKGPENLQALFSELFHTDYPEKLAHALLNLADLAKVPRSVTFYTNSTGQAPESQKQRFNGLNGRTFQSRAKRSVPAPYAVAQDKQQAFFPSEVSDSAIRPVLRNLFLARTKVTKKRWFSLPAELRTDPALLENHLNMRFLVNKLQGPSPLRVFLRIQQAGNLQVGKFLLTEKLVRLKGPYKPKAGKSQAYELWLTGPLSEIDPEVFESDATYEIRMSVSANGTTWSTERSLAFRYEDGKLGQP